MTPKTTLLLCTETDISTCCGPVQRKKLDFE